MAISSTNTNALIGTALTIAPATGPAAPFVLAAATIAKFLNIGAGRSEADLLTDPPDGAQFIVGQAFAQLIRDEETTKALGQLNRQYILAEITAIEQIRAEFERYSYQFPRAGPGARSTINEVAALLTRDRYALLATLPANDVTAIVSQIEEGVKSNIGLVAFGALGILAVYLIRNR